MTDTNSKAQVTDAIARPARVGSVVFQAGVSAQTVIAAAQRFYEHREIEAQEKPEPGVAVKALEWDIFGQAQSIAGLYDVSCIAQGGVFGLVLPGHGDNTFPYSVEGSEAECRAAAQADYEQRIRSALVSTSPSPIDKGEVK